MSSCFAATSSLGKRDLLIIIIIIIILLHYHKGLSAVGLSLPTDSLGLRSIISCVLCPKGVFRLCKAIEKNIQLGAGERGGGTERDNVRVNCFVYFLRRGCV